MLSAPTATELQRHPLVKQALDQAWLDSLPDDPSQRHEEGGWIYMDVSNGNITVRRAMSGGQDEIDLGNPAMVLMSVVTGGMGFRAWSFPIKVFSCRDHSAVEGDLLDHLAIRCKIDSDYATGVEI